MHWTFTPETMANKIMDSDRGYICTLLLTCVLLFSYAFTAPKFPLILLRSLIFIFKGMILKKMTIKTRKDAKSRYGSACRMRWTVRQRVEGRSTRREAAREAHEDAKLTTFHRPKGRFTRCQ
jgi:hypothetical protein